MHFKAVKSILNEIQGKNRKLDILLSQFDPHGVGGVGGREQRVDLTSSLDSLHMVSYYLPIHFMTVNATVRR